MTQLKQTLQFVALVLTFAVVLAPAHATYVPKMDTKSLVSGTALVLEGTVSEVDTAAGDENGPKTRVTFTVDEVVFGDYAGSKMTFELPVGELPDGTFMMISNSPFFDEGQSYLLFVRDGDWNLTPVTNWNHSYFRKVEQGNVPYFVSETGRGVSQIGETGIDLAEKIAAPNSGKGLGTASEALASNPAADKAARPDVGGPAKPGEIGVRAAALNAAQFKTEIRRAFAKYGKANGRVAFAPLKKATLIVDQKHADETPKPEFAIPSPNGPGQVDDVAPSSANPVENN